MDPAASIAQDQFLDLQLTIWATPPPPPATLTHISLQGRAEAHGTRAKVLPGRSQEPARGLAALAVGSKSGQTELYQQGHEELAPEHSASALAGEHLGLLLLSCYHLYSSAEAQVNLLAMQDTPRDAAAAYLASLQTTEQVLKSLQQAWAAKRAIQAGSVPTRTVISLPAAAGRQESDLACDEVKISMCGTYLAVCASTRVGLELQEVLIYNTEGFELHARVSCGSVHSSRCQKPQIQWASDCPQLSLFSRAPTPTASIIDAHTGQVLRSLSPETMKPVGSLSDAVDAGTYESFATWAPSGLLLEMTQKQMGEITWEGELRVYDMHADTCVAVSAYTALGRAYEPAFWHPSSRWLVLGAGTELHDISTFEHARVGIGKLPSYCMLQAPPEQGFSSDGQYYLAKAHGIDPPTEVFVLLQCCLQDNSMLFTLMRIIQVCDAHWVPHSHVAILRDWSTAGAGFCQAEDLVSSSICCDFEVDPLSDESGLFGAALSFSPSHGLVSSSGMPQVRCLKTGMLLWSLESQEPYAEAYDSMAWLPSGRGLVYHHSHYDDTLQVFTFS